VEAVRAEVAKVAQQIRRVVRVVVEVLTHIILENLEQTDRALRAGTEREGQVTGEVAEEGVVVQRKQVRTVLL
jgi:hypothetical protein